MANNKVIADPIHGTIVFQPYLIKIINHQYFQRLRHIKQLQCVEHVYPGGVHSRFSHSLGVCFLAGKVLDTLERNCTKITDYERQCVTIAALCHDIGHGPFSHLYEDVANAIDGKKWKHEEKSLEITRKILTTLRLFDEEKEEKAIKTITTMISGRRVEEMTDEEQKRAFLFQIVNNANNGVDVDKWDYFTRDSHACGFPSNFDKDRAVCMVRVAELKLEGSKTANVLSFPKKDEINLYNMFGLRYTLHSKVYKHPVVCCVDEMIADLFKLRDSTKMLKFKDKLITTKDCRQENAVDEYCLMDDRLVYLIYNTEVENVDTARKIIDRIRCRDFYKCIYEKSLTKAPSQTEKEDFEKKASEELMKALNSSLERSSDVILKKLLQRLKKEDRESKIFRIKMKVINYGNKEKNPIENVYFYGKGKKLKVLDYVESITPMVPKCFEENTIQIICTLSKEELKLIDWDQIIKVADVNTLIQNIFKK